MLFNAKVAKHLRNYVSPTMYSYKDEKSLIQLLPIKPLRHYLLIHGHKVGAYKSL